jgi:hypothetical protein
MLMPMAACDQGKYAAMLIIEDEDGLQRATGVLGLFDDVDTACRYALEYGIGEVDDHDNLRSDGIGTRDALDRGMRGGERAHAAKTAM